jgi:hypothetical protein
MFISFAVEDLNVKSAWSIQIAWQHGKELLRKVLDQIKEQEELIQLAKAVTKDRPGEARPVSPSRVKELSRSLQQVSNRSGPEPLPEAPSLGMAAWRLPDPKPQDMPPNIKAKIGSYLKGKPNPKGTSIGGRTSKRRRFGTKKRRRFATAFLV